MKYLKAYLKTLYTYINISFLLWAVAQACLKYVSNMFVFVFDKHARVMAPSRGLSRPRAPKVKIQKNVKMYFGHQIKPSNIQRKSI